MERLLVLVGFVIPLCFAHSLAEDSTNEEGKGGRQNITQGAIFTEDFRQQEGVQETKNGILYKIETTGNGKTPRPSDRVKVSYAGRHVDGRVFDQSKEGQPREFKVDARGMIEGWQNILIRMREGDKWRVVIPPRLAYGALGSPFGNIGPNETLDFTIELLEVLEPIKNTEVK